MSFREDILYRSLNLAEKSHFFSRGNDKSPFKSDKKFIWNVKQHFGSQSTFHKYLDAIPVDAGCLNSSTPLNPEINAIDPPWLLLWENEQRESYGESWDWLFSNPDIYGFEYLCKPLLEACLSRVLQTIDTAIDNGLSINRQKVIADFSAYLCKRISYLILPSLLLEANIARLNNTSAAKTPEERFRKFVNGLDQEENRQNFWGKYPALLRLVSKTALNCVLTAQQTLERLASDRCALSSFFDLGEVITVTAIQWGTGDSHCGGKVVAIIYLATGKIVYKPRCLGIDKAFNEFLLWYAEHSGVPSPEIIKVLDCGEYGYTAFVEATGILSREDAATYYHKLGALLAIAWLLGLADLHHENLIASGADPYLVDVEVIFTAPLKKLKKDTPYLSAHVQAMQNLLFATGVLPSRRLGAAGIYDMSALGSTGEQPAPDKFQTLKNYGRDDACLVLQNGVMPREKNTPTLQGSLICAADYVEDIILGFDHALNIFGANKEVFLGGGSPLRAFCDQPIRYIARSTREYGLLLENMSHPTVLRNGIECDLLIGGTLWAKTEYAPFLKRLIASEVADLWEGDVPFFHTTPDSCDVLSANNEIYKDFFSCSGMAACRKRFASPTKNRSVQIEAIRLSLKSTTFLDPDTTDIKIALPASSAAAAGTVTSRRLLQAAIHIGEKLIANAHYEEGLPFWIGMSKLDGSAYKTEILHSSLYEGASGIGVFFGALYRMVGDHRYKKIAEDVHNIIHIQLGQKKEIASCGAFSGFAGHIYADMLLSTLLHREISYGKIGRSLVSLKHLIKKDTNHDVVAGAAGALLIALRVHNLTRHPEAIVAAEFAAERLELSVEQQKTGIAWRTLDKIEDCCGGMAHGVSGIGWSLSEWADHTKQDKWLSLARDAFKYEQSLFDTSLGAWKDARNGATTCAWCYGAAGIGLAVNKAKNVFHCDMHKEIMTDAQNVTWRDGFSKNHCLCHGNLGNAELYLVTKDKARADAAINFVMRDFEYQQTWNKYQMQQVETPGLMCGLSGIGYGLLRHASPQIVPCLLDLSVGASDRP